MPRDFDKYSSSSGISMSETLGRRVYQQDAMFVGYINKEDAVKDPKKFLKESISEIEIGHKDCSNGTTLCSAIVQKDGDDTKITIGNLGDSRTAVVVKYKDSKTGNVEYKSILLTEDHDLELDRVKNHIEENGGVIKDGRVNGKLNMGAAIGDKNVVGDKGCLLRVPDIFEYKLSDLYNVLGITTSDVMDVNMVVSCDGMWDLGSKEGLQADYVATIGNGGKQQLKVNSSANGSSNRLSDVKKNYDKDSRNTFASHARKYALDNGSQDNISVIDIPFVKNGENKISEKPIMATMCDGHGSGSGFDVINKHNVLDGALVSAAVASELYQDAEISQIKSLEIENDSYLYKFLTGRNVVIKVEEAIIPKQSKKDLSSISKSKKQNWFAEWNKTEESSYKQYISKGAAASKITTTESYIECEKEKSIIGVTSTQGEKQRNFIKNFPYFQQIQGDGFCALHSSIVGILAKCVDNKEKFDEFKEKLEKWRKEKNLDHSLQNKFNKILKKLDKDNLSYQDFYELVSEKGEDNISTLLSHLLLKNTNFDDEESRKKLGFNVEEKEWEFLKEQQQKEIGNIESLSDVGAIFMLQYISPFKLEFIKGDLSEIPQHINKDSIYIIHNDDHFSLLHSNKDENLAKAVNKFDVKKESEKNPLDGKAKVENSHKIIETSNDNLKPENKKRTEDKFLENRSEILLKETKQNLEVKEIETKRNDVNFRDENNAKKISSKVDIKTSVQDLKIDDVKLEKVPLFQSSSTFKNSYGNEQKISKKLQEKYGQKVDEKTKELIKNEIANHDKVFSNKLIHALNKLKISPKNYSEQDNDSKKVKELWNNLTTLDKRVLVDYYNQNSSSKIDFMSLYKDAQGEKSELRVQSKDYVLDISKIKEVAFVIGFAAKAIPSTSIQNPTICKLSKIENFR